ncbi:hypothetical protein [Ensifer sp. MJa1]|uniref:hypothetical protein n=1 Tax=Ensifer sp. MJa1 TaxID=2919888 RepID=UPI00300921C1
MKNTNLPKITPPHRQATYDHRSDDCQEALREAFAAFVDHCTAAGWSDDDVAMALIEIADEHFCSLAILADVSASVPVPVARAELAKF